MSQNLFIQEILDCHSPQEIKQLIEEYLFHMQEHLFQLHPLDAKRECISGFNRMQRKDWISHEQVKPKVGDICFIDFGQAYINEAGFQHFGLVVSNFNYKSFVIPMSSNRKTIQKAYNYPYAKDVRTHLYYIGLIEGLNKPSVLFLNDGKFINTSRIISVNAHINEDSKMFQEIKNHMHQVFG